MAGRDRFADVKELVATETPVIVDGGAYVGSTIDIFLKQYHAPVIYDFEPNPDLAKGLKKRFSHHEHLFIHHMALGAERRRDSLHILKYAPLSSILLPSDISRRYHETNMDIAQAVEVPRIRLDEMLNQGIGIVTLDLQVYELEALRW